VLLEKNEHLYKEQDNLQTTIKEQYLLIEQSRSKNEELKALLQVTNMTVNALIVKSKDKMEIDSQNANENLTLEIEGVKQQLNSHKLASKENESLLKRNKELQTQVYSQFSILISL
jgi:hypothetical protein